MPAVTPVTTPVLEIVALPKTVLHTPPETVSERVVVLPTHTSDEPEITPGDVAAVTVTTIVLKQPVPNVYVIVLVPAANPVTTPVEEDTVAIAGVELLHTP